MPNFDFVDKLPNYLAEVKIYWARCYELQNDHQEMKTVQKMEDDINDGIVECKECRLMLRKDSKRQPVFLPLENRDAHVRFHLGYRYKRRVSRFETMWERCFGDGIVNDSEEEKTPEPKNQKKQKSKMSKMALEETEVLLIVMFKLKNSLKFEQTLKFAVIRVGLSFFSVLALEPCLF